MKKIKDVVKDALTKDISEQDEEIHQTIKAENEDFRNRIQRLEGKLDELIDVEERAAKSEIIEKKDAAETKQPFDYSSELVERGYKTPIQRLAVFGILKVKLIKWTLLAVDIPKLNIDLKRMD